MWLRCSGRTSGGKYETYQRLFDSDRPRLRNVLGQIQYLYPCYNQRAIDRKGKETKTVTGEETTVVAREEETTKNV